MVVKGSVPLSRISEKVNLTLYTRSPLYLPPWVMNCQCRPRRWCSCQGIRNPQSSPSSFCSSLGMNRINVLHWCWPIKIALSSGQAGKISLVGDRHLYMHDLCIYLSPFCPKSFSICANFPISFHLLPFTG